jgi:hypothetical protein
VLLEDGKGLGSAEALIPMEYGMRVSGGGAAFLYVPVVTIPSVGRGGSTMAPIGEEGVSTASLGRS